MLNSMNNKSKFIIFWLLALIIAPLTSDVNANIYSYTAKDGTVHFTNMAPDGKNKKKYKVYLKSPEQRKARAGVSPIMARDKNPNRYSKFDASIIQASQKHSIPEAFVRAVIKVESDYDPRVVSIAGAQGLMQLMPATAKRMGCTNAFDPHQNIMGGTRYLRHLANLFNGDMVLTIAGYHAGEGAVRKYKGVPPYKSTQGYIKKVLGNYYKFKKKLEKSKSQ